jgi:hypothetical protein
MVTLNVEILYNKIDKHNMLLERAAYRILDKTPSHKINRYNFCFEKQ